MVTNEVCCGTRAGGQGTDQGSPLVRRAARRTIVVP